MTLKGYFRRDITKNTTAHDSRREYSCTSGPRVRQITVYTTEEIIGRSVIDLMQEEAKLFGSRELKKPFSRGETLPTCEVPALHHEGHTIVS